MDLGLWTMTLFRYQWRTRRYLGQIERMSLCSKLRHGQGLCKIQMGLGHVKESRFHSKLHCRIEMGRGSGKRVINGGHNAMRHDIYGIVFDFRMVTRDTQ